MDPVTVVHPDLPKEVLRHGDRAALLNWIWPVQHIDRSIHLYILEIS